MDDLDLNLRVAFSIVHKLLNGAELAPKIPSIASSLFIDSESDRCGAGAIA